MICIWCQILQLTNNCNFAQLYYSWENVTTMPLPISILAQSASSAHTKHVRFYFKYHTEQSDIVVLFLCRCCWYFTGSFMVVYWVLGLYAFKIVSCMWMWTFFVCREYEKITFEIAPSYPFCRTTPIKKHCSCVCVNVTVNLPLHKLKCLKPVDVSAVGCYVVIYLILS